MLLAVLVTAAAPARTSAIHYYPLPLGAAILDDAPLRPPVGANARGDVVANVVSPNGSRRIIVWDVVGDRRVLEPPKRKDDGEFIQRSTEFGVVASDGTVYGVARYVFSGAWTGSRFALLSWRGGEAAPVDGAACTETGSDVAPVVVSPAGRIAFTGLWDGHLLNIDTMHLRGYPPTAGFVSASDCRAFDRGWLSALDERYGAGLREYFEGTQRPIDAEWPRPQADAVAVRFVDGRVTELGPGAALGVNARGDCVGTSAPPPNGLPMLWRDRSKTILSARRGRAYGINESGRTIVGAIRDANGRSRAVRWVDGRMTFLDTVLPNESGTRLTAAYGVTASGGIYGVGIRGGVPVVFVLYTP